MKSLVKVKENVKTGVNKKYKSILLVSIFLIFFRIIDLGIGEFLSYYTYFKSPNINTLMWNDFYKHEKNSIDLMFLGSSHARFAFDTRAFNNSLGVNTFNLSSSEQTPVIGYYVLKEALKYQKPKILVYETYWRLFGTDDNTTPAFSVYNYIKGYDTKLQILLSLYREKDFSSFLLQSFSKTYEYREAFTPAVMNVLKGNLKRKYTDYNNVKFDEFTYYIDGFFGSNQVVSNNKLYKTNPFIKAGLYFKWDNKQIEYFKKTIDLCKKNNIKVLMVTAPLPNPTMKFVKNYDKYNATLMQLSKSLCIQYIDYNMENIKEGIFKNNFFFDSNHLNIKGTEALDNMLIPILKNYLH